MAKANTSWNVLPHRPLEKVAENLWRIEGDIAGMPLKRVMTVAKRSDEALVVHNAIALEPAEMAELDAWGKVRYLIVPNGWHRLDARVFQDRYPDAGVFCPSGARKRVEEVVPVKGTYEDFPADSAVSLTTLDGVAASEGIMSVKSKDGVTLVFNDALFNMPHLAGFQGFILRYITQSSGPLHVSRIARLLVVKRRKAFREHLERLAATPELRRIIVAHHEMVDSNASAALKAAVEAL
jgi:hypothetical protein